MLVVFEYEIILKFVSLLSIPKYFIGLFSVFPGKLAFFNTMVCVFLLNKKINKIKRVFVKCLTSLSFGIKKFFFVFYAPQINFGSLVA